MIRLLPCSLVFPWIARAVGHGRFRAGRVYPDETLRNEPLRACADGGLYSLRVPSSRSRALERSSALTRKSRFSRWCART